MVDVDAAVIQVLNDKDGTLRMEAQTDGNSIRIGRDVVGDAVVEAAPSEFEDLLEIIDDHDLDSPFHFAFGTELTGIPTKKAVIDPHLGVTVYADDQFIFKDTTTKSVFIREAIDVARDVRGDLSASEKARNAVESLMPRDMEIREVNEFSDGTCKVVAGDESYVVRSRFTSTLRDEPAVVFGAPSSGGDVRTTVEYNEAYGGMLYTMLVNTAKLRDN